MIAGALRYAADFLDAVQEVYAERRAAFTNREAGDYLDASGITDATLPDPRYMTLREFLATATDEERAEMAAQCDPAPSKCRVCSAGPIGQRLHACPDSRYYVPGSDPAAELTPGEVSSAPLAKPSPGVAHADLAAHITATFASIPVETDDAKCADLIASVLLAVFHITRKK